eukprot:TRINITY_DN533_c4_g1_i1.p1 TRINITY_DN533_c4_g1~~TRINITY_DN533_c4_g1_i1.p1  ORF type:complete len:189 (+),score=37.90 TRINITY_DN533_c4_g1_i1:83-568(+)
MLPVERDTNINLKDLATTGLSKKIIRYEELIEEQLKPRLQEVINNRDNCFNEITEGEKLRAFIDKEMSRTGPMEVQVDLGHHFYAKATVEDTNSILICVGMGLYVRYTLAEAKDFLDSRQALIEERIKALTSDASRIKVEMKIVLEAINEVATKERIAAGG